MQATLTEFIAYLITLLHLWLAIMGLFRWKKGFGRDLMGLHDEDVARLTPYAGYFAIQCGMLGCLLLWTNVLVNTPSIWDCQMWAANQFRKGLYIAIAVVGIYGGVYVNRKLLALQTLPAVIGFFLT
jgi:uncharacterized membrane protein